MPRSSRRSASKGGNTIEKEVANLFALGNQANQNTLLNLRHKYGDDQLVDEIERVFVHRHADVVKKAKNFANAVRNTFNDKGTLFPSKDKTPREKAISVADGIAQPFNVSESPRLI